MKNENSSLSFDEREETCVFIHIGVLINKKVCKKEKKM